MNRYLLLSALLLCIAGSLPAQMHREFEKAKKDPQTEERAARADVRLIDLKQVTDGKVLVCKQADSSTQSHPAAKERRKKKS